MIEAKGISKQFLRKRNGSNVFFAVRETNFCLPDGKLTVITGRSGSGKSTLLNMLAGILEPTSGEVLVDGENLYQMEDGRRSKLRNRLFGFVPQGQSTIHSLSVLENVMLPYTLYGEGEGEEGYARELLEAMGIEDLGNVMPSELSGGEMRRMAIARALVRKPAVVFADEPTGDLDDENTEVVFDLLKKIAKEGTAVLLVTHEGSAVNYADQMFRMDGGAIYGES